MHPATTRRGRRPLTAEQQQLAVRYLPMGRALARAMIRRRPEWEEEFLSAAHLALVEAAEAFDPTRNIKFSTYARHRIVGELRQVLRRQRRATWWNKPWLEPSQVADGFRVDRGRSFATGDNPRAVGWELETREEVEHLLRQLPRRRAAICRHLFLEGQRQVDTAQTIGSCQSEVSRLARESLDELYDYRKTDPALN